jgi:glycosyltransferase involved in cell wall biosynthesis
VTSLGRRRLLVVASTFPGRAGDGIPAFVRNLADREARNFEVLAIVPRVPGAATEERLPSGVTVRRFRYFPRRWERVAHGGILDNVRAQPVLVIQAAALMLAELFAVRRAVRKFRPDVAHVHWLVPQGVVALAALGDCPWLLTTLGGDVYGLRGPIWRWLKRRVARRAAAVTAMNADMAERMRRLGASEERVRVMPMGIDVDELATLAQGVHRVPGRLVFVGRLVPKKGVDVLLDALARLDPALTWTLDVVGDGPQRAELEHRAVPLGDRVRFLGQLGFAEVVRALAAADVVVVPSIRARSGDQDGLPLVLEEAMTIGSAVVASDLPGLNAAIEHGRNGWLAAPGDPAALAAGIGTLLVDGPRRAMLGKAAREVALRRYSLDVVGAAYVDVLTGLVERRGESES